MARTTASARRAYHARRGMSTARRAGRRMLEESGPPNRPKRPSSPTRGEPCSDEVGLAPSGFAAGWRERLIAYFSAGIADGSQLVSRSFSTAGRWPRPPYSRARRSSPRSSAAASARCGRLRRAECRRMGLARRLVTHALQRCRTCGCTHVTLQSRTRPNCCTGNWDSRTTADSF